MLKDLVRATRSYRSFDSTVEITREQLAEFVDHARLSASSINLQMLKFRFVTEKDECAKVRDSVRWATKVRDIVKLPPEGREPVAYIVICTDRDVHPSADSFLIDVGIAAEAIMLAATEAGFGGCMMSSFNKKTFPATLALPSNLTPHLVLSLGRPNERVEIAPPAEDGSVTYYRKGGIHYVQKRNLEDLIVK